MSLILDIDQHELRRLMHKACGFQPSKVIRKKEAWLVCSPCKKYWKLSDIRKGKAEGLLSRD